MNEDLWVSYAQQGIIMKKLALIFTLFFASQLFAQSPKCDSAFKKYIEENMGGINLLSIEVEVTDPIEEFVFDWEAPGVEGFTVLVFDNSKDCELLEVDHYEQ